MASAPEKGIGNFCIKGYESNKVTKQKYSSPRFWRLCAWKAGAERSISADLIFFGPFLYQDKKGLAPAAIEREDVKV